MYDSNYSSLDQLKAMYTLARLLQIGFQINIMSYLNLCTSFSRCCVKNDKKGVMIQQRHNLHWKYAATYALWFRCCVLGQGI